MATQFPGTTQAGNGAKEEAALCSTRNLGKAECGISSLADSSL